jgi:hypothetical protein
VAPAAADRDRPLPRRQRRPRHGLERRRAFQRIGAEEHEPARLVAAADARPDPPAIGQHDHRGRRTLGHRQGRGDDQPRGIDHDAARRRSAARPFPGRRRAGRLDAHDRPGHAIHRRAECPLLGPSRLLRRRRGPIRGQRQGGEHQHGES